MSSGWEEYCNIDGIETEDLYFYHYDRKKLERLEIKGIWLQYYLKEWGFRHNAEFSKKMGLQWRSEDFDPNSIGTYVPFSQLDSDLVQVNQMLKYIKFGFGQCLDHACYDLRDGNIDRKQAIDLVTKYDGKCAEKYIKKFCEYIDISVEEFWKTAESFRGSMWKKDSNGNWENIFSSMLNESK